MSACYEPSEANEPTLFTQFDTNAQGVYLLAYSGLLVAHLPPAKLPAKSAEELTLIYVTHTVVINGSNLVNLMEIIRGGRAKRIFVGGEPSGGKFPVAKTITVTEGVKSEKAL
jgi:hypothetical protein